MVRLLHLSDLHFGSPYVQEVGEAVLASANELQPSVVVVSGDFTQRAKREQFRAAKQFLEKLPQVPCVVTPGNHDIPLYRVMERVRSPYANYQEYISDSLDTSLFHEGVCIASINSTSPMRAVTNGRISREQLDFCSDVFAQAKPESLRIVVAHHHFAPAPDYEGGAVMPNAKRAIERFTELKVDMILGGHLHRAYIGNSLDFYSGRDREHGILIVQSGTTTSRRGRAREREKNTFNLIESDDQTIRVTHYMYFERLGGFNPVSQHLFPRAGEKTLVIGSNGKAT